MAVWTKADFDAAYVFRVERRLGPHPSRYGRPEVRIGYHEYSMRPMMVKRWRRLLQVLTPAIDAQDRVLIVGAGFGWGVRALRNRVGCAAIGTDTSPYIQAEKDNDDRSEISERITAVGLDPTSGRGLFILNAVTTSGKRSKETVLNEDMRTVESRQAIATALGGSPTWIITEDIVEDAMTDAEITTLAGQLNNSNAKKVWLYTPTRARSSQQLAALTGQRVIEFGSYRIVG